MKRFFTHRISLFYDRSSLKANCPLSIGLDCPVKERAVPGCGKVTLGPCLKCKPLEQKQTKKSYIYRCWLTFVKEYVKNAHV